MQHCLSSPHSLTAKEGQPCSCTVYYLLCTLHSPSQVPAKILTKQIICCSCQARGGAGRAGYGQGRDVRMTIGSHSGSILCPPAQLSSATVTGFIQVGNFKLRLNCNLDPLAGVGASVMPGPASTTAICLLSCCHGPWGRGQQISENCSEGHQYTRTQHINTPLYVPDKTTIFIS